MRMRQMRNEAVGISIVVILIRVVIDGGESGGEGDADNEEKVARFLEYTYAGFHKPTFESCRVEPIRHFDCVGDLDFNDSGNGRVREIEFEHGLHDGTASRDEVEGRATGRRTAEQVVRRNGANLVKGIVRGHFDFEQGDSAEIGDIPDVEHVRAE